MFKSVIAIVILAGLAVCSGGPTFTKIAPRAVEGIEDCGSNSDITDIRVTDCTAVPCEAVVGNQYRIEVDFKPHASHSKLHLNIVLIHNGEWHSIIDREVPDSAIIGGSPYTFGYTYDITGAFMGPGQIAFNLLGEGGQDDAVMCFYVRINVSNRP